MTRNFTTLRNLPSAAFTQKRKSRLELGHVLFIDVAGYSKLTTEEESEALPELTIRRLSSAKTLREFMACPLLSA